MPRAYPGVETKVDFQNVILASNKDVTKFEVLVYDYYLDVSSVNNSDSDSELSFI